MDHDYRSWVIPRHLPLDLLTRLWIWCGLCLIVKLPWFFPLGVRNCLTYFVYKGTYSNSERDLGLFKVLPFLKTVGLLKLYYVLYCDISTRTWETRKKAYVLRVTCLYVKLTQAKVSWLMILLGWCKRDMCVHQKWGGTGKKGCGGHDQKLWAYGPGRNAIYGCGDIEDYAGAVRKKY